MRKISLVILIAMLLPALLAFTVSAETSDMQFGSPSTLAAFERQSVTYDLESALIGGEMFSTEDYPYVEGALDENVIAGEKPKLHILSFVEYGFSKFTPVMRRYEDYSLFIYFYNPSGANFLWSDLRNKVTMSFGNRDSYDKYDLQLCSIGGDGAGHENLYIKYKVNIPTDLLRAYAGDGENRLYVISEFELVTDAAAANATAYKVGGRYTYSGTMVGYGTSTPTLSCSVRDQLTLDLECHDVVYRSDKNAADDGLKNQLNSVYFSIPNEILDEYGGVVAAEFGYYEYDSGSCLGVSTNRALAVMKGFENKKANADAPVFLAPFTLPSTITHYYWSYNTDASVRYHAETILSYVFKCDNSREYDAFVDTDVKEQFNEWWRLYCQGEPEPFFSRQEKPSYTVRYLDNRRREDIYEIGTFNGNWIQQLFGFGFSGYDFSELAPIVVVEESDLSNIEKNLKVESYFSDEIRDAYDEAVMEDSSLHLLRFALSDYFSMLTYCNSAPGDNDDFDGFVAMEKMYMDFDVLSLTFSKEGKDTIIPVAGSPINVVPDFETPSATIFDRMFGKAGTWEDKLFTLIFSLIAFVILLQVLSFFFPVIQPILNKIYKFLLLPFRLFWKVIVLSFEKVVIRR